MTTPTELPTPAHLMAEMIRLSKLLDNGVAELVKSAREYAEADDDYRRAKAQAFFAAPEGSVKSKEAHVDRACLKERGRKLMSEAMRLAALEAIRSRRSQMSALQSMANAVKADTELATYASGR